MNWLIIREWKIATSGSVNILTPDSKLITHLKKEELLRLAKSNRVKIYKTERAANNRVNRLNALYGTDGYKYIREDQLEDIINNSNNF